MKRKMLVVTMTIAMMMASLMAACGNNGDVPANNTIIVTPTPTSEPTQTPDPTIAPDDEGVVDSGVLDDVPDASEDGNGEFSLGEMSQEGTSWNYTIDLREKGYASEAWLGEFPFENPEWSAYFTYFKNANGDEMSFRWIGPVGIGASYGISPSESTFNVANDNRRLVMWHGGKLEDKLDYLKSYSASENMELSTGNPIADTYQVVEDSESAYRIIFKVETEISGTIYTGFATFVDYYDINECYQFEYYMSDFNEVEALAVVNSIERVNLDDLGIIVQE